MSSSRWVFDDGGESGSSNNLNEWITLHVGYLIKSVETLPFAATGFPVVVVVVT